MWTHPRRSVDRAVYSMFCNRARTAPRVRASSSRTPFWNRSRRSWLDRSRRLRVGDRAWIGDQRSARWSSRNAGHREWLHRSGRQEGARLAGRHAGRRQELARGYSVPAVLSTDVDNGMRMAQEEIFGPVVAVIPFRRRGGAVRLANEQPLWSGRLGCGRSDVGARIAYEHGGCVPARFSVNCYTSSTRSRPSAATK